MKKIKMIIMLLAIAMTLFACKAPDSKAATSNGVSINVPTTMDVSFNEDGTTTVSDMYLENDSIVPVEVQSVNIEEFNNWKVVPKEQKIPVNTKKLSLQMGEKELLSGSNVINREVAESERYDFDIQVNRGAWTYDIASEKALELEVNYEIGSKAFVLTLDENGSGETTKMNAENGSTVSLPSPTKDGYDFAGWKDENGNLYKGAYTMPIGDTTLQAVWKKLVSYAIYLAQDQSLRFIRTSDTVTAGGTYKGMTITNVFTGFDTETYSALKEIPWYDGDWYDTRSIKKVIVEDVIQPESTAYWFYHLHELEYMDVSKLDLTKVTDMSYTFYKIGWKSPGLTLVGFDKLNTSNVTNMTRTFCYAGVDAPSFVVDISSWDVSNVTTMYRMFMDVGYNSTTFSLGDLSKWDVSNVTDMYEMFINAGLHAEYYMDLSGWNVSKVKTHPYFDSGVDRKIGDPKWVY